MIGADRLEGSVNVVSSILWRRLDVPGHDACRLTRSDRGWSLDGTAVFRENGAPRCLTYAILCDPIWRTERGEIHGWVGDKPVRFVVERMHDGTWTLNGSRVPGLEAYVDLDLGFTPATNMSQLRRVGLATGHAADVPVAWLDATSETLTALPQRYERRTPESYWYESPTANYEALLEVGPGGFVHRYPRLWEAEL